MTKGITLNPLTGRLRLTNIGELFSIKRILSGEEKEVPLNRQMLLCGSFRNDGLIKNSGEIVLISLEDNNDTPEPFPDLPDDNFSHMDVAINKVKTIPNGQQMILHGKLKNNGTIKNFGEIYFQKDFVEVDPIPFVHEENFSFKEVLNGQTKTISAQQQMILSGVLKNRGMIKNLGEIAVMQLYKDVEDQYLPPFRIDLGETFKISKNRIMSIKMIFRNYGTIKNNGIFQLGV